METKPELTSDQKLRIIIAHRDYIRAEATRQFAFNALNEAVNAVGKELGIEKGKYDIDLETFELTEKK
jgi:hypothetical protein